jgi:formate dehydrogenase subunit gamma
MSAFDARQAQSVDALIARFAGLPGPLLPILHAVQEELGYVPREAVAQVATALNLSRAEVHGVVSFYHHFRQQPPGRQVLQLCRAEACQAVGCEATEAHARARLGVDYHGTSADGPSVMLDGKLHGRVTPQRLDELLQQPDALQ